MPQDSDKAMQDTHNGLKSINDNNAIDCTSSTTTTTKGRAVAKISAERPMYKHDYSPKQPKRLFLEIP